MFISELFHSGPEQPKDTPQADMVAEANQTQLVVLLPGRFQPFHLGHADVFHTLQGKFGRDNVFITTSNVTDAKKSPFNFSDKTILMHAAGVPSDRILEVQSPYKLPAQFDPASTVFVVAVGAPDAARLKPDSVKKDGNPGYFKTFKSLAECEPADKHGYVVIAAERHQVITLNGQQVDVSHGTPSRAAWNMVRNDPKGREEYMTQMFGRADVELGRVLDKIPASVSESRKFSWGDFADIDDMESKMNLVEAWASDKGMILEDNNPAYSAYFTELFEYSEVPKQNKKYIVTFLALVNDKISVMQVPVIAEYLGKVGNQYAIKMLDGNILKFPYESVTAKTTANTFFFADEKSYEEFRTAIIMKFTVIGELNLSEGIGKKLATGALAGAMATGAGAYMAATATQSTMQHGKALAPITQRDPHAGESPWAYYQRTKKEKAVDAEQQKNYHKHPKVESMATQRTHTKPTHPADFDDLVSRVKAKAQQGPMKTVWVADSHGTGGHYKVVPTNSTPVEEEGGAPMTRQDYMARRKSLQQIQMDPDLAKDPMLRKELIKKIAQLTMQARAAGVLPESVYYAHVHENRLFEAQCIINTIRHLQESIKSVK